MPQSSRLNAVVLVSLVVALSVAIFYFSQSEGHLRGDTMKEMLAPYTQGKDSDKATVSRLIVGNYTETRQIAALWSGLYWGFTWAAAVLGALSGLILKLESFIPDEKIKKDIAAVFTVTAAIMITVSTGGEFQRKWQANRFAAATIEQIGYDFLAVRGENAITLVPRISEALKQRHMAILGKQEPEQTRDK